MFSESAFSTENCIKRLREAYERLEVVRHSLDSIADDFLESYSKPLEQLAQMADKLPELVLIRALAQEGLALIEQITWEAYICENSLKDSGMQNQSLTLSELAKSVQAHREFLEWTIERMNSMIQMTMDTSEQMADIVASLKNTLDSKPE